MVAPSRGPSSSAAGGGANAGQQVRIPACVKKLVRSIVRTFYAREHSLIVDMLVRNTIMKEDDLCERLRFEKKQLRQFLHTLKTDQFIKTKLQLETDTEGKTTKITHYFIDYKLFVNVVKYRLDQMQRRLEAGQRQSSSRATFKCLACATTYSDLEIDRLLDIANPGRLLCVYCRAEVMEEAEDQDSALRTDARALIAKFHRQIRDPIDNMLRECDEIHLSSSILEPEIRPLQPMEDGSNAQSSTSLSNSDRVAASGDVLDLKRAIGSKNTDDSSSSVPAEGKVRIILSDSSASGQSSVKQRPIWLVDSTVPTSDPNTISDSLGLPERGGSNPSGTTESTSDNQVTQTLTPGRVPTGSSSHSSSTKGTSEGGTGETTTSSTTTSSSAGGDVMQMLLVHERRGASTNANLKSTSSSANGGRGTPKKPSDPTQDKPEQTSEEKERGEQDKYVVRVGERLLNYHEIKPSMVKMMTAEERLEYVRVGKQLYMGVMFE